MEREALNPLVHQYQQDFSQSVRRFLTPNHYKGTTLLRFIKHLAIRWHIFKVDPYDVLEEAVYRGLQYIKKTESPIRTPEAWLRQTSINILRDEVKKVTREERLAGLMVEQAISSENPSEDAELLEQLNQLEGSLKLLSQRDQEIVRLRFFEGKTYRQIQRYLSYKESTKTSLSALRKRESRALQRLRKSFFKDYHGGADAAHQ